MDIKLYKIKDNIRQGRIELHYMPGVDQLVDGLTKALLKDAYKAFQSTQTQLGNYTTTSGTSELILIDLIPIFRSLLILFFTIGHRQSRVVNILNFLFLNCYLYYYYLLTITLRSMVQLLRRGFLFARAHRAQGGVLVGGGHLGQYWAVSLSSATRTGQVT